MKGVAADNCKPYTAVAYLTTCIHNFSYIHWYVQICRRLMPTTIRHEDGTITTKARGRFTGIKMVFIQQTPSTKIEHSIVISIGSFRSILTLLLFARMRGSFQFRQQPPPPSPPNLHSSFLFSLFHVLTHHVLYFSGRRREGVGGFRLSRENITSLPALDRH